MNYGSICLSLEGGSAYGTMALWEPIKHYLATGLFPDVLPRRSDRVATLLRNLT